MFKQRDLIGPIIGEGVLLLFVSPCQLLPMATSSLEVPRADPPAFGSPAILTVSMSAPATTEAVEVEARAMPALALDGTLKKAAAASAGALMTSLFVNPLDVAKVRIQSQIQTVAVPPLAAVASASAEQCRCKCRCVCNRAVTRPVETMASRSKSLARVRTASSSCVVSSSAPPLRGTGHALRHIFQTEGVAGLFSGLSPAMVIAVPSTVLYYVSYDFLLQEGRRRGPEIEGIVPLLAGATARVVAASVTSPIELVRTRMQGDRSGLGMVDTFRHAVRRGGYQSLFAGLGATLARDVPFSALYWTTYEALQHQLAIADREERLSLSRTQRAFVCGALSGSVSAMVTTPFDVVKTLQQVSGKGDRRSGLVLLRQIVATKGAKGAFTGLGARLARVAPSCAIMISCYELGKERLGM